MPLNRVRGVLLFFSLMLLIMQGCDSNKPVTSTGGNPVDNRWEMQSPLPTDRTLHSIYFIDEQTGWIAGNGIILHTADGGETWTKQLQVGGESYREIKFADANTGWAIGTYNAIRYTNDGGKTWTKQTSGTNERTLTSIAVHNHLQATAIGWNNTVLQTTDGGQSWVPSTTNAKSMQDDFNEIHFFNPSQGLITAQSGTVLASDDSGRTWTVIMSASPHGVPADVALFDAQTGLVCTGSGKITRTVNGGLNWQQLGSVNANVRRMSFIDQQHGWVAGENGVIQRTENGGSNWSPQQSGVEEDLYDIFFLNQQYGWAVGFGGIILRTVDGGQNWKRLTKGPINTLLATDFVGHRGWAAGQKGTILSTRNKGMSWENQISPTNQQINDLDFVDSRRGWAVGERGTILYTDNGGEAWTAQQSPVTSGFRALQFLDSKTGWVVSNDGIILHTTNGGNEWIVQNSTTTHELFSVFFLNESEGWVSGLDVLLRTTNGGSSWEKLTFEGEGEGMQMRDIVFLDSQTGYVVSNMGLLYSTPDGGATWTNGFMRYNDGYSYATLHAITFVDDRFGWIVGEGILGSHGVIFNTQDGGKTWTNDQFLTANGLYDVAFTNRRDAWIVGENGMIIHTEQGDL